MSESKKIVRRKAITTEEIQDSLQTLSTPELIQVRTWIGEVLDTRKAQIEQSLKEFEQD